MKALIRGERAGSLLTVLILVAVLLAGGVALGLAVSYRTDLTRTEHDLTHTRQTLLDLKHVIYNRCVQREHYDEASQLARLGEERLYRQLIALDLHHPVTAPGARALQTQRITDYRTAVRDLQQPLRVGVPQGCGKFR